MMTHQQVLNANLNGQGCLRATSIFALRKATPLMEPWDAHPPSRLPLSLSVIASTNTWAIGPMTGRG